VGILVLLTLSNIVSLGSENPSFLVPAKLIRSIYIVTMQIVLFSTSVVIEVFTILRPWFLDWVKQEKWKQKQHRLDNQIPSNSPDLASPAGLFFMGIGFAWLTGTFLYSAIMSLGAP
jgi:hypothetical protein